MIPPIFKFRLQKDKPDSRDVIYQVAAAALPISVDLRTYAPPVRDQGYLGSCVPHAAQSLMLWNFKKFGQPDVVLSPLFLYWYGRQALGRTEYDSGSTVRDVMKVMAKIGVCPENYYPVELVNYTQVPSTVANVMAGRYKIASYARVKDYTELPYALAAGNPVVFGITAWSSIYKTGSDGIVPMYDPSKDYVLGGHGMVCFGYKPINGKRHYICRNSWGEGYGDHGDFYVPEEYFYLATDMWTATTQITTDELTFEDSLEIIVDAGIFDTPEFWLGIIDRFRKGTLTNDDFKYVELAFIKFATYLSNNVAGHIKD